MLNISILVLIVCTAVALGGGAGTEGLQPEKDTTRMLDMMSTTSLFILSSNVQISGGG
jgi:hypothetical protein